MSDPWGRGIFSAAAHFWKQLWRTFSAWAWRVQDRELIIVPVRFFKMKVSLGGVSALPGEGRVGEFLKRKQGRLGMEPPVL
jgi:hypothetical protein